MDRVDVAGLRVASELHGFIAEALPARGPCEELMRRGVLAKDTHETTIRIAPPLVASEEDLGWALDRLDEVLSALD